MTNIHIGDSHVTHGANSPITVTHYAAPDRALGDVIRAVAALRAQVAAGDQAVIDEFLRLTAAGGTADRHRVRAALAGVAQVATAIGTIGLPVLDAIQKLLTILGT